MKEWCGVVGQVLGPLYRLSGALQLSAELLTLCFTETLYVHVFHNCTGEQKCNNIFRVYVCVCTVCCVFTGCGYTMYCIIHVHVREMYNTCAC